MPCVNLGGDERRLIWHGFKQVAVDRVGVQAGPPIIRIQRIIVAIVNDRPSFLGDESPLAVQHLAMHNFKLVFGAIERDDAELVERLDGAK